MREYVLDQSRNLMDQPGAEEAGAGSGDGAFGERGFVPPQPLDPAQAAALLPYFRNAQKFAPPTRQAEIKRKVLARARTLGDRYEEWRLDAEDWLAGLDLAPDLAEDIGSRRWFRGLGTMLALGALAFAFWPDFTPLEVRPAMPESAAIRDELRSQMITRRRRGHRQPDHPAAGTRTDLRHPARDQGQGRRHPQGLPENRPAAKGGRSRPPRTHRENRAGSRPRPLPLGRQEIHRAADPPQEPDQPQRQRQEFHDRTGPPAVRPPHFRG